MRIGKKNTVGMIYPNMMVKIYDNTLVAPATSITISGLNGDTDVVYELITKVVSGNGALTNVAVYPNSDKTTSHYGYQYFAGSGSSATAGRSSTSNGIIIGTNLATGDVFYSNLLINAKSGIIRTYIRDGSSEVSGVTVTSTIHRTGAWSNTADNITSLLIDSNVSSGLGNGTRIELYTRRNVI